MASSCVIRDGSAWRGRLRLRLRCVSRCPPPRTPLTAPRGEPCGALTTAATAATMVAGTGARTLPGALAGSSAPLLPTVASAWGIPAATPAMAPGGLRLRASAGLFYGSSGDCGAAAVIPGGRMETPRSPAARCQPSAAPTPAGHCHSWGESATRASRRLMPCAAAARALEARAGRSGEATRTTSTTGCLVHIRMSGCTVSPQPCALAEPLDAARRQRDAAAATAAQGAAATEMRRALHLQPRTVHTASTSFWRGPFRSLASLARPERAAVVTPRQQRTNAIACAAPTHAATQARTLATAAELLRRKTTHDGMFAVPASASVSSAVQRMNATHMDALVVVNDDGGVAGMVTSRDLLRHLDVCRHDIERGMGMPVHALMTPADRIVCVAAKESVHQCARLMSELHIHHLPVVQEGEVLGIITLQDIAGITYEAQRGGKDSAVRHILPRRGMALGTRVPEGGSHSASRQRLAPLFLRTGVAAMPRPARQEQPSEDAYFVSHVWWPGLGVEHADEYADRAGTLTGHTTSYIGISDGVGSWHEFGVDPRQYSTRLMEAAAEHVWRCAANGTAPPSPQDVLAAAWETTIAERVVGSATAAILTLNSLQSACNNFYPDAVV